MSQSNLPLYTVVSEDMFKAIRVTAWYNKGPKRVVISSIDHVVGLKDGDKYYAQQFGTRGQASDKYRELKEKLRNGEEF